MCFQRPTLVIHRKDIFSLINELPGTNAIIFRHHEANVLRDLLKGKKKIRDASNYFYEEGSSSQEDEFRLEIAQRKHQMELDDMEEKRRMEREDMEEQRRIAKEDMEEQRKRQKIQNNLEFARTLGIPDDVTLTKMRQEKVLPPLIHAIVNKSEAFDKPGPLFLEPTEMAKMFNFNGAHAFNKWLAEKGFQTRHGDHWFGRAELEDKAWKHHRWVTDYNYGYNLKWSVSFVQSQIK